jgi:hypothetical protein
MNGVPFRFLTLQISFHFVGFRFLTLQISLDFVFVSFRFVSFRFSVYRYPDYGYFNRDVSSPMVTKHDSRDPTFKFD